MVRQIIQRPLFQVTGHLHVLGHVPPKPLKQRRDLLPIRLTEILAKERLDGALVLVVGAPDDGHVDPELFKHSGVEHALAPQSTQEHASLRMQVHFIRSRVEVQSPLAHGLAPCHHKFAAVLEDFQPLAQIFHHAGHDCDVVDVEENTLNLVISRGSLESIKDLIQTHLHVGLKPSTEAE